MKKTLTFFTIFTLASLIAVSQSIGIAYSGGSFNNGDTITLTSTDANATFALNIWITNNSSDVIEVKAKKTELSIISGSDNYFCSWTSCYQPSTFMTPDSLPLPAGETNKVFTVDYMSNGNAGKSTVMYTFFDRQKSNDSIAVIVNYIAGSAVGIESNEPKITLSNAYPNPVKNAFYLDYNFSEANTARVEVINVIGSIVKVQNIQDLNGKARIDVSDLNNGVYFYSLIVDGKKYISKKLIVQK